MQYALTDQVSALAGLLQAANLVETLAKTGSMPEAAFSASIGSLFITDPKDVNEVYGGRSGLALGYEVLHNCFSKQADKLPADSLRYAMTLLFLERSLSKKPELLDTISRKLAQAENQREHFGPLHENVIANLAGTYQETLSTFKQRIQVTGDAHILQTTGNANKIRALLLAGIRSAMLWHQVGGRRWQLLFKRKKIAHIAGELRHFAAS